MLGLLNTGLKSKIADLFKMLTMSLRNDGLNRHIFNRVPNLSCVNSLPF